MSCITSTAPRTPGEATGALRATMVQIRRAGKRQLEAVGAGAPQRRPELCRDVWLAHDLEVMPAVGRILHAQHAPCGVVDELHPPLLVDDDDPLHHAAEDGLHARLVRGEVRGAPADFAHRVVQRPRDGADLVVAIVPRRPRQVAGGVALRDGGNRADPPAEQDRDAPCEAECREQAGA